MTEDSSGSDAKINNSRWSFLKWGIGAVVVGAGVIYEANEYLKKTEGPHEVFNIQGTDVKISWTEFGESKDPTESLVCITGWPYTPKDESEDQLPKSLASAFSERCLNISVSSRYSDPESLRKQAEAMMLFLQKRGVKKIPALVGQSAGALIAGYMAVMENSPVKTDEVVFVNPRGLDQLEVCKLMKVFASDMAIVTPAERKYISDPKSTYKKRKDAPGPGATGFGFLKSLGREIQATGGHLWGGTRSRVNLLTNKDDVFKGIKIPVTLMLGEKDEVSSYRNMFRDAVPDLEIENVLTNRGRLNDVGRERLLAGLFPQAETKRMLIYGVPDDEQGRHRGRASDHGASPGPLRDSMANTIRRFVTRKVA